MKKSLFLKNSWLLAMLFIAFGSGTAQLSAALKDDVLNAIKGVSLNNPAGLLAELKKQEAIVVEQAGTKKPYDLLGADTIFLIERRVADVVDYNMDRALWQSMIFNVDDPYKKDTGVQNSLKLKISMYQTLLELINYTQPCKIITNNLSLYLQDYVPVIQGYIRNAQYFIDNPTDDFKAPPTQQIINFGDEVKIRSIHTNEYLTYTTSNVSTAYKELAARTSSSTWRIEDPTVSPPRDGQPVSLSDYIRLRNVNTNEVISMPPPEGHDPQGLAPGASVAPIFLNPSTTANLSLWKINSFGKSSTLKSNMPFRIEVPSGPGKGHHIHTLSDPSRMKLRTAYPINDKVINFSNVFGLKEGGTTSWRGNDLWYISTIVKRALVIKASSDGASTLNKKLKELIDNFSFIPNVLDKTMPLLLNTNFNDESKRLGDELVKDIYFRKSNDLEYKAKQVKLLETAIISPYLKQNKTTYLGYIKTLEADMLKIELNNQLKSILDTTPTSAFYERAFSEMPSLFDAPVHNSSSSWIGNNVMTKIYNQRSSLDRTGKQKAINLLIDAQTCAYLTNYKSKYADYVATMKKELSGESEIQKLNDALKALQPKPVSTIMSSLPTYLPKTTYNSETTSLGHKLVDKVFNGRDTQNADSLNKTKTLLQKAINSPYLSQYKGTYQGWIDDINNEIQVMPRPKGKANQLKYGDIIAIGSTSSGSKFLWSQDNKKYFHPTSSRQQMVGLDTQESKDTLWQIQGPDNTGSDYRKGEAVHKGDIISLRHVDSGEYLHSHDKDKYGHKAPYTTNEQEVTCHAMNDDGEFIIDCASGTTCELGEGFVLKHRNSNRNIIDSTSSKNQGEFTNGKQEIYAASSSNTFYLYKIYTQQEADFFKSQEPLIDGSNSPTGTASTSLKYGDIVYITNQDSTYPFWGQDYAKSTRSSTALLLLADSTPANQENMFIIRPDHGKSLDSKTGQIIKNNDAIRLQHLLTGTMIYYQANQNPYLENIDKTSAASSNFLLVQIDAPVGVIDAKKAIYLRHEQSGRYLNDISGALESGFTNKYKIVGVSAPSGIQNSSLKTSGALKITPVPKTQIPVIRPQGASNELKYGDTISVNAFHGKTSQTYLWSENGKRYSHAKSSKQQMVGMSPLNDSNTLWRVVGPAGVTAEASGTPLTYNETLTFKETNSNTVMYSNQSTYSASRDMYKAMGKTGALTADHEFSIRAQHGRGSTYGKGNPINHGDTVRVMHNGLSAYIIYAGGRGYITKNSSSECNFQILDANNKAGPLTSTSKIILKHVGTGRYLANSSNWYSLLSTSKNNGTQFTVRPPGNLEEAKPAVFEEGKRVLNGDKISLQHIESGAYLHSHQLSRYGHTAPYSTNEQEVTANNIRNADNNFIISYSGESLTGGRAFSLKHVQSNWFVETHPTKKGPLTDNKYEIYATKDYNDGNKMILQKIHTAASIKTIKEGELAANNLNKQIEAIIKLSRDEIMTQLPPLFSSPDYNDATGELAHQGVKKVYDGRKIKDNADNQKTTTFLTNAQKAPYLAFKKTTYTNWLKQLADEKKIIDEINQLNNILTALRQKSQDKIMIELPQYFDRTNYNNATTDKAAACVSKVINQRDKQNKPNLLAVKNFLQKSSTAKYLESKQSNYQGWIKTIEREIALLDKIQQLNDQIKAIGAKVRKAIITELTPLLPEKEFNDQTTTLAHQAVTKAYNNRNKADTNILDETITFLEAAQLSPFLVDQSTIYTQWIAQCVEEKGTADSITTLNNAIKEIGAKDASSIAKELLPHLPKKPFNTQTTTLADTAINKSFNGRKTNYNSLAETKKLLETALTSPYLTSKVDSYNTMLGTLAKNKARLDSILELNEQIIAINKLANVSERAQGLDNIVLNDKKSPGHFSGYTQQLMEKGIASIMAAVPKLTQPKDLTTLQLFKKLINDSSTSRLLAKADQQKAPNRIAIIDAAINQIKLTSADFDELIAQLTLMIQQAQGKPFPSLLQQNFTDGLKALNGMIDGLGRADLVKLKDFLVAIALKFPGLAGTDNTYIQKTMLPRISSRIALIDKNNAIKNLNSQIQSIVAENIGAIITKLTPLFPSTPFNNDTTTLADSGVQKVFNGRNKQNLGSLKATQTFLTNASNSPYLVSKKKAYETSIATLNTEIKRLNDIAALNNQLIAISKKAAADIQKEMPALFSKTPFDEKTDDHAHVGITKVYNNRNKESVTQLKSVITFLQQASKSPYMATRKTTYENWIKEINKEINALQSISSLNNQIKEINAKNAPAIMTELPPLFQSQPYNATTTTLAHAGVNKAVSARNKLSTSSLDQTIAFIKKAQASPYLQKHKDLYNEWIKTINQERGKQLSISQLNAQLKAIGAKNAAAIIKEMTPLLPSTPFNNDTTQIGHAAVTKVYNENKSKNPTIMAESIAFFKEAKKSPYLIPHIKTYDTYIKNLNDNTARWQLNATLNGIVQQPAAKIITLLPPHLPKTLFNSYTTKKGHEAVTKAFNGRNKDNAESLNATQGLLEQAKKSPYLKPHIADYDKFIATITQDLARVNGIAALNSQIATVNKNSSIKTKAQGLLDIIKTKSTSPFNAQTQKLMAAGINDLGAKIDSLVSVQHLPTLQLLSALMAEALETPFLTQPEKGKIPGYQAKIDAAVAKIQLAAGNLDEKIQFLKDLLMQAGGKPLNPFMQQTFSATLEDINGMIPSLGRPDLIKLRDFLTTIVLRSPSVSPQDKDYIQKTMLPAISTRIKAIDRANAIQTLNQKIQTIIAKDAPAIIAELPQHFDAQPFNNDTTNLAHSGVTKAVQQRNKNNRKNLVDTRNFTAAAQKSAYLTDKAPTYTTWITTINNEIKKLDAINNLNKKLQEIIAKDKAAIMTEMPAHFGAQHYNNTSTSTAHEGVEKVFNGRVKTNASDLQQTKSFIIKAQKAAYLSSQESNYTNMIKTLDGEIGQQQSIGALNKKIIDIIAKAPDAIMAELPPLFSATPFNGTTTTKAHEGVLKVHKSKNDTDLGLLGNIKEFLEKAIKSEYLAPHKAAYTKMISGLNVQIGNLSSVNNLNEQLAQVGKKPIPDIIKELPGLLPIKPFDAESTKLGDAAVNKVFIGYQSQNPTLMKQAIDLIQKAQQSPYLKQQAATYTKWINTLNNNIARWNLNVALGKVGALPVAEIIKQLPPLLSKTLFNATSTNRGHAAVIKVFEGRTVSDLASLQATQGLIEEAKKSPYLKSKIAEYDPMLAALDKEINEVNSLANLNNQIKAVNENTNINTKAQGLLDIITSLGKNPYNSISQTLMAQGINDLGSKINSLNKPKDLPTLQLLAKLMQEAEGTPLLTNKEKQKLQGYQDAIAAAITRLQFSGASFDEQIQKIKDIITTAAGQPLNPFMEQTLLDILKNLTSQVDTLSKDQLIKLKSFVINVIMKSPSVSPAIKAYIQNTMLPAIQKALDTINRAEAIEQLNNEITKANALTNPTQKANRLIAIMTQYANKPFDANSQKLMAAGINSLAQTIAGLNKPTDKPLLNVLKNLMNQGKQTQLLTAAEKKKLDGYIKQIDTKLAAINQQVGKANAINALNAKIKEIIAKPINAIITELPAHFPTTPFNAETTTSAHTGVKKVFDGRNNNNINALNSVKTFLSKAKASPYLTDHVDTYDGWINNIDTRVKQLKAQQTKNAAIKALNDKLTEISKDPLVSSRIAALKQLFTESAKSPFNEQTSQLMSGILSNLMSAIPSLNKKDTLNALKAVLTQAAQIPFVAQADKNKIPAYLKQIDARITELEALDGNINELTKSVSNILQTAGNKPLNPYMQEVMTKLLKKINDLISSLGKDDLLALNAFLKNIYQHPSLSPTDKNFIMNTMIPAIKKALDAIRKQEELAAQQKAIAELNKKLTQITSLAPKEIITELTPLLPNSNNSPFNGQSSELTLDSVKKVFNSRDPKNLESLEFIKPFLQAALKSPFLKNAQQEIQGMINTINNEIQALKAQMSKEQAIKAFQKRIDGINAVKNFVTRVQQHASVIDEYNKQKPLSEIQTIFEASIRRLVQQLDMNNLPHLKAMLTTMNKAATSSLISPVFQATIKAPIIPNIKAAIKRIEDQMAADKREKQQQEAAAQKAAELAQAPFATKLSILMSLIEGAQGPLDKYMASVVSRALRELFVQIEDLTESQLKQLKEFLTNVILRADAIVFEDRAFASTVMIPAIDEALDAIALKKQQDAQAKQQFTAQQEAIAAFQQQMAAIDAVKNFDTKIKQLDALVTSAQGKTFIPEIQNIYASSLSKFIPLMASLSISQLNKLDGFLSRTQNSPLLGAAQQSYVMGTMKLLLQQQKAKLQAAGIQQPIEDNSAAEAAARAERESAAQAEAEKQKALTAFTQKLNSIDEQQDNNLKFSLLAKEMYSATNNIIYPEMQARMTQSLSKLNNSIPTLSENELARLEVVLKQAQVTQLLNPAQKSYILPPLYTAIETRRNAIQREATLSRANLTEQERQRLEQEQAAAQQKAQQQTAAQQAQQAQQEQEALNTFVKALNPIVNQTNIDKKLAGLITLTQKPPVSLITPAIQQQYMMALMPLYQNVENRTASEVAKMKQFVQLIQTTPLVPATQRSLVITQLTFAIDDAQRALDQKSAQLSDEQRRAQEAAAQAAAQEAAAQQAQQQTAAAKQNRLTMFKAQINTMNALTNNDEKIAGLRQVMINTQTDGLPIYEEMQNLFFESIMKLTQIIPTAPITTLNNLGALLQIAAQSPLLSSERQPQAQELFEKQVMGQIAYLQQAEQTQAQQQAQQAAQEQELAAFNTQLSSISAQLDFASRIASYQQLLTNAQGKTFSLAKQSAFAQNLEQFYNQASTFSKPQLEQTIQLLGQALNSTLLNEAQKAYIESTVIPNLTAIFSAAPTYTKTTQTQMIGPRRDSGRQPAGRIARGQTGGTVSKAATFTTANPQERGETPATRSGIIEAGTTERQAAGTTTQPRQRESQTTTQTRPRTTQTQTTTPAITEAVTPEATLPPQEAPTQEGTSTRRAPQTTREATTTTPTATTVSTPQQASRSTQQPRSRTTQTNTPTTQQTNTRGSQTTTTTDRRGSAAPRRR